MSEMIRKLEKYRKRSFPFRLFLILGILAITNTGCDDTDEPVVKDPGFAITGVSIPSTLDVLRDAEIMITGKGFEIGDQIHFTSKNGNSEKYSTTVTSVTPQSATFSIPTGILSGNYTITVSRSDKSLMLGSLSLSIIVDATIPDKEGMTVKGIVYSDGVGCL